MVAAALAHVEEWLLDPAEGGGTDRQAPAPDEPPIVAVVPLAPRCGSTTVARGLGAVLATRSAVGAALVCGQSGNVALSLSTPAASRLGRSVGAWVDAPNRVSGRLCLVEGDARIARAAALRNQCALVVDVTYGADASEAAALADLVVLVAAGDTEPSLAAVVGAALARSGPEPLLVLVRADADSPAREHAHVVLPDARLASRIALAGREPPGTLGSGLAELADRCARSAR